MNSSFVPSAVSTYNVTAWSYKERTPSLCSGPLSLLGNTDHRCQVQAKPGHYGNTVEEHLYKAAAMGRPLSPDDVLGSEGVTR